MALVPSLSDIKDLTNMDPDEYSMRILRAMPIKSQRTGRAGMMMIVAFEDEDTAKDILHSLWYPMESDEKSKADNMWRMIKEFMQSLGLNSDDELEKEDFEDLAFNALIDIGEDMNGAEINIIKRVL